MDRVNDWYKAASEGNIEPFKENNNGPLEQLITPNQNTILHIYIVSPQKNVKVLGFEIRYQAEKATEFVGQILEICPSLLMKANERGDTPLHLAAKFGHLDIVKVLIESANAHREDVESDVGDEVVKLRMLRKKNNSGNTALHEAVSNNYSDVVKLLTKEDSQYSYSANNSGESPLSIATEFGSLQMVKIILKNCQSPSHEGPDGKTALHLAARSNNLDVTKEILSKRSEMTKARDDNGWTSLHYAAYYGHFSVVQYLLERDGCAAFAADNDRKMTPLHLAAAQGCVTIMEEIISRLPNCCEMVDRRGWNFLHFALAALHHDALYRLLVRRKFTYKNVINNLINAKDMEGNTPLHVYAVSQPYFLSGLICQLGKQVRLHALNNENDSIFGTQVYGSPILQEEIDKLKVVGKGPYRRGIVRSTNPRWTSSFFKRMEEGRDAQLVVAALVATVTFAAALTVPGGFDQVKGTSLLNKITTFQAFIITDAIAMVFSLFAVFLHFIIAIDFNLWGHMFQYTIISTGISIVSMVIAFVTGTYAILTPSLGLAILTTCIGLSFFGLVFGALVIQAYHLSR